MSAAKLLDDLNRALREATAADARLFVVERFLGEPEPDPPPELVESMDTLVVVTRFTDNAPQRRTTRRN